jgi:type II secretory pathway pseudopilin PulG
MLARRLRSRLHGERGFTIVETVVAMVVIFGSLTALAYTATIGFRYIAFGRDRIQATGYANEIMESVRALPYTAVTNGLDTAEYATDSNIVSCSGEYRFLSCTGQKLVGQSYASGYTEDWLVPHTGTVTTDSGLDITWSTYVTNDDPTANPYSVTVQVSWDGGAISTNPNNLIRVQSDVWSPTGCVSSTTHPFAAPCQPFFYGQAVVPESEIQLTGLLHDSYVDFESGGLALPGLEAAVQEEQTAELDVGATSSSVWIDDSTGRTEDGFSESTWAADSDPDSAASETAGGVGATGAGGSLERLQEDCCDEIGMRVAVPSGDASAAGLSTEAASSDPADCPTNGTAETDGNACAGGEVRQGGIASAVAPLDHALASLGDATVVRVGVPSAESTATVDRDASATSSEDGLIDTQASRALGTIWIGGFPSAGMTAPTGMSTDPTQDANYCLRVSGYADTVRAIAGESTSTAPTASVSGGTLWYWNSGTGTYSSQSVTSSSLSSLTFTCSRSETVDGSPVEWKVRVLAAGNISPASTSTASETDTTDTTIKLSTEAVAKPIALSVDYEIWVDGILEVDLSVTTNLGSLTASSVYGPPPEFGV